MSTTHVFDYRIYQSGLFIVFPKYQQTFVIKKFGKTSDLFDNFSNSQKIRIEVDDLNTWLFFGVMSTMHLKSQYLLDKKRTRKTFLHKVVGGHLKCSKYN